MLTLAYELSRAMRQYITKQYMLIYTTSQELYADGLRFVVSCVGLSTVDFIYIILGYLVGIFVVLRLPHWQ